MATRKKSASTRKVQAKLRLPDGLRTELAYVAKKNGVSLNQEIVNRLHASFEPPEIVRIAKSIERQEVTLSTIFAAILKSDQNAAKTMADYVKPEYWYR